MRLAYRFKGGQLWFLGVVFRLSKCLFKGMLVMLNFVYMELLDECTDCKESI